MNVEQIYNNMYPKRRYEINKILNYIKYLQIYYEYVFLFYF